MAKPIRVYSFDSNPAIDSPKFHTSHADADIRVKRHHFQRISAVAIQEPVPAGYEFDHLGLIAGGGFREAWGIRPSGGMPVWQMRPVREQVSA